MRVGGYAETLEKTGELAALFQGHFNDLDQHAGKEIRKEWSKKVKETKEDKQFGSIKSAIEKGSKKDE